MKKKNFFLFFRNNGLVLSLLFLFLISAIGLAISGFYEYNEEQAQHGEETLYATEYLFSSHFLEAIFENWESEFFQMWALVILTIFLRQKGSPDSKKLIGKEDVDTKPRYSIINAKNWNVRMKAISEALYAHSLGLALLALFLFSFILHAYYGMEEFNNEALAHGESTLSFFSYMKSSQFWYESFQNWQSEFLSVAVLMTLAIFLRERGSAESKPIGESNSRTGS